MLSGATVKSVGDGAIVLAHDSVPLAKRLVEPRNAEVIKDALRDVFGVEWTVVCEAGDGTARSAAPAPASAPAERPASTGPRFSRPSRSAPTPAPAQSGSAPARSTPSRPSDDDIPPPPEEPDYPDDPGPSPYDGPPPPESPEEQEELMKQAKEPVDPSTRRDPDEVALELLQSELGATPLKDV
ncbi:DNA polymerase III subunit gamma/tau [Rhodococcus sp. BP-331]|nr:DNA polymerase III subunit gamma/tau [Rhodococcus sp. BP-331]